MDTTPPGAILAGMTDAPMPIPRWYRLTPDRLVRGLLVLECLLWLSEQFRWLPFNRHKGWTVLIALAVVGAAILTMLLWFVVSLIFRHRWLRSIRSLLVLLAVFLLVEGCFVLCDRLRWLGEDVRMGWILEACVGMVALLLLLRFVAKLPFRWQFQFGIGSLLMLTVIVAILCSWTMARLNEAKKQAEAVRAIEGAWVSYDYQVNEWGEIVGGRPREPTWLLNLFGYDFFADVVGVFSLYDVSPSFRSHRMPITDAGLEHIKGLRRLHGMSLTYTQITDGGLVFLKEMHQLDNLGLAKTGISDAGLHHLEGMTQLRYLNLTDTKVTDEGVKKLQQALPDCKIVREYP